MKEQSNENDLLVTENEDGTLTVSWDETNPKWMFLNNMSNEEIQTLFIETITNHLKYLENTIPVEFNEETGEYYITFTDTIMEKTGWKEGDYIKWIDNEDGSFSLMRDEIE